MVRQRPAKPCTRVRFPSPPPILRPGAVSSAGERFPDTEEVAGSIPVPRTTVCAVQMAYPRSVQGFMGQIWAMNDDCRNMRRLFQAEEGAIPTPLCDLSKRSGDRTRASNGLPDGAILGCRSLLGGREGSGASIKLVYAVADDGAAAFGGEDTPVRRATDGGHERSVGVQRAGRPHRLTVLPCWEMTAEKSA